MFKVYFMKKVRVMLTVIAIVSVAGGVLAVKAKSFGADAYCTTILSNSLCCISLQNAVFAPVGTVRYVKTIIPARCGQCPLCTGIGLALD